MREKLKISLALVKCSRKGIYTYLDNFPSLCKAVRRFDFRGGSSTTLLRLSRSLSIRAIASWLLLSRCETKPLQCSAGDKPNASGGSKPDLDHRTAVCMSIAHNDCRGHLKRGGLA